MEGLHGERFDCILAGTDVCTSVVAAALARRGKRVLHVDANGYYGGSDASMSLSQLHSIFSTRWPRDVTEDHDRVTIDAKEQRRIRSACASDILSSLGDSGDDGFGQGRSILFEDFPRSSPYRYVAVPTLPSRSAKQVFRQVQENSDEVAAKASSLSSFEEKEEMVDETSSSEEKTNASSSLFVSPDGTVHSDETSWRANVAKYYSFEKFKGKLLTRLPGEICGEAFQLRDLEECTVRLLDTSDSIVCVNLKNCTVFCGISGKSVTMIGCEGCAISTACSELKIENCADCVISVHCRKVPDLKDSTAITLCPFRSSYSYPGIDLHFAAANLDRASKEQQDSHKEANEALIKGENDAPEWNFLDVDFDAPRQAPHLQGSSSTDPARRIASALRIGRKFSVDITPRFILCRGSTVDALVDSGVSRYLEFKSLDSTTYLADKGVPVQVPCSKSQVFKSRSLGMIEKRQLMKFLQFCNDKRVERSGGDVKSVNEEGLNRGRSLQRPQNKKTDRMLFNEEEAKLACLPFEEFLVKTIKMKARLAGVIAHAVAFGSSQKSLSAKEGLECVQKYLYGLGRYGNSAFLCCMYGVGEVSQGFCRLSAVKGSVYVLRERIDAFVLEQKDATETETSTRGVLFEDGTFVRARHVVVAAEHGATEQHVDCSVYETRCVAVVSRPIVSLVSHPSKSLADIEHPTEGVTKAFLVIPPNAPELALGNEYPVHVMQVDYGLGSTPQGYYVLQLTTLEPVGADGGVLDRTLDHLLSRCASVEGNDGPSVHWSTHFRRHPFAVDTSAADDDQIFPYTLSPGLPALRPDISSAFESAERIVKTMYPEEFDCLFPPEENPMEIPGETPDQLGDLDHISSVLYQPQRVDLQWFLWLGGKLAAEE